MLVHFDLAVEVADFSSWLPKSYVRMIRSLREFGKKSIHVSRDAFESNPNKNETHKNLPHHQKKMQPNGHTESHRGPKKNNITQLGNNLSILSGLRVRSP